MRTPEDAALRGRGTGCLVRGLAVLGGLTLVLLLAGAVALALVSRPGAPGTDPAPPSSSASERTGPPPPSDLGDGERWLPQIDLTAPRILSDDTDLRAVHLTGSGGRVSPEGTMRASRLDIDAVVPFSAVEDQVGHGLRLAPADGGLVRVSVPVGLFGRHVDVAALARVTAEGDTVAIDPVRVVGADVLGGALDRVPAVRRPVPGLPRGMTLTNVEVTGAGFAVHATGRDVSVGL